MNHITIYLSWAQATTFSANILAKMKKFRETFVYKVSKFGDTVPLKGVGPEIFDLHFFHDSNSSRPLINMFEFGFDFAEKFDFAMCVAQRSQTFLLW